MPLAVEQHLAVGRLVEPGDDAQQGRLAAAGRTEDGDEVVFLHVEVDRQQRLRALAARPVEDARHALDGQLGRHSVLHAKSRG